MKQFVLLFRMDITTEAQQPSPQQMERYMAQWTAWTQEMAAAGHLAPGGHHLARGGKVLRAHGALREGPYVADGVSVAGYLVVTTRDMDEAVRIAQRCPILQGEGTSVEVRATAAPGA